MSNSEKMRRDIGENHNGNNSKELGKVAVDASNRESIRSEFDRQSEDSKKIREAFSEIDGKGYFALGVPYADSEEEGFSGDGASLFMLVQFQKEDGPKTELVKIGWGEFSKQTFTKGDKSKYSDYIPKYRDGEDYRYVVEYEVLRSLPFDVYCVRQSESYLTDEETQNDMCFHPEKYLKEHALFVVKNGNVTMTSKRDNKLPMSKRNRNLEYPIVSITEEEALKSIDEARNLYEERIKSLSGEA